MVVREGPTVPCSSIAASVIRRRVSAMSSARFFSWYLRLGELSRLIVVSSILTDRLRRGTVAFYNTPLCRERREDGVKRHGPHRHARAGARVGSAGNQLRRPRQPDAALRER